MIYAFDKVVTTGIAIAKPKSIETILTNHLFFDTMSHIPAGITNTYFEIVWLTFIISGKKTIDK